MDSPLFDIQVFDKKFLNFYANYEFSTIIVSLAFLLLLYLLADKLKLSYLNLKNIDAPVVPVRINEN
ncbi:MAG: hypothetical protein PHV73_05020 [Eubacteriales bacterium]|nr:hypothetical protein [Eubacteriales bacterium]